MPNATSITTTLTLNCSSHVSYTGSPNQTTSITINYQNNILWATMVNNTSTEQTLSDDSSAGPVILHKGSKVKLQNLNDSFNILFTGSITDSGSTVDLNGTIIGSFSTKDS